MGLLTAGANQFDCRLSLFSSLAVRKKQYVMGVGGYRDISLSTTVTATATALWLRLHTTATRAVGVRRRITKEGSNYENL